MELAKKAVTGAPVRCFLEKASEWTTEGKSSTVTLHVGLVLEKEGKTDSSWKDLMHEFGAKTRGSAHVNYEFKKGKYFRLSIMAPDELGAVVYEPILHVAEQGNGEEGEIVQHEQKLQWKKFNPKQLTAPVELVKSCIEAIEYVSKVWDSAGFTQAAQQTVKDLEENERPLAHVYLSIIYWLAVALAPTMLQRLEPDCSRVRLILSAAFYHKRKPKKKEQHRDFKPRKMFSAKRNNARRSPPPPRHHPDARSRKHARDDVDHGYYYYGKSSSDERPWKRLDGGQAHQQRRDTR